MYHVPFWSAHKKLFIFSSDAAVLDEIKVRYTYEVPSDLKSRDCYVLQVCPHYSNSSISFQYLKAMFFISY